MKFFKWLYPGIGIKRWVILAVLGIGMLVIVGFSAVKTIAQHSVLLASFTTAFLMVGIFLVYTALKQIVRIFVRALMPLAQDDLVNIVYQSRKRDYLARGPRVVALGGGTGLSVLLSGIKMFTNNITAIVTVTDTGGSSGRLREELDILPPGDIRNCLVALADAEPLIRDLFQYRFTEGQGLKGHSFGNLFITALERVTGDFEKAIRESSKVLAIRGHVLPSTLDKVTLVGEFRDGSMAEGETSITAIHKPIRAIRLKPEDARATEEVIEALETAELIILGPGSLYTSIIPNLLIKDIMNGVLESDAYKIFVINVMTQPGETEGFSAADHLQTLIEHTDPRITDACLVNVQKIPKELLDKYCETNSFQVENNLSKIKSMGYEVIGREILKFDEQIRHDSVKLAKALFDQYFEVLKK